MTHRGAHVDAKQQPTAARGDASAQRAQHHAAWETVRLAPSRHNWPDRAMHLHEARTDDSFMSWSPTKCYRLRVSCSATAASALRTPCPRKMLLISLRSADCSPNSCGAIPPSTAQYQQLEDTDQFTIAAQNPKMLGLRKCLLESLHS